MRRPVKVLVLAAGLGAIVGVPLAFLTGRDVTSAYGDCVSCVPQWYVSFIGMEFTGTGPTPAWLLPTLGAVVGAVAGLVVAGVYLLARHTRSNGWAVALVLIPAALLLAAIAIYWNANSDGLRMESLVLFIPVATIFLVLGIYASGAATRVARGTLITIALVLDSLLGVLLWSMATATPELQIA